MSTGAMENDAKSEKTPVFFLWCGGVTVFPFPPSHSSLLSHTRESLMNTATMGALPLCSEFTDCLLVSDPSWGRTRKIQGRFSGLNMCISSTTYLLNCVSVIHKCTIVFFGATLWGRGSDSYGLRTTSLVPVFTSSLKSFWVGATELT